jgi:hypothetical protein
MQGEAQRRPVQQSPRFKLAPLSEPTEFDERQPRRSWRIYSGERLRAMIESYDEGWYVFVNDQRCGPYPTRAAAFADVEGMNTGYSQAWDMP